MLRCNNAGIIYWFIWAYAVVATESYNVPLSAEDELAKHMDEYFYDT